MQKLIKTTCKIAAEDIGRERAKHIAEKAQRRYQELCLENSSDPKALRAHTFKRIYPAIAAYEVLREDGVDQEKAVCNLSLQSPRWQRGSAPCFESIDTEV